LATKLQIEKEYNGIKSFYAHSRSAWRNWLKKNHTKEKCVWLIIYRMDSGIASVYYKQAVEEALCFGWIDSKPNKRDEKSYYQYFAKRNPKSKWSKINKDKIEELIKDGLMMAAGLAAIETAKQNGTWTALDAVEQIIIPQDLQKTFAKNKKAWKNFKAFPRSVKKAILDWVSSAKKPETRLKRISETVSRAEQNQRANFPNK
jgi:uncharacterized protein YdeI (YjbR/CyaY-like superfamily)